MASAKSRGHRNISFEAVRSGAEESVTKIVRGQDFQVFAGKRMLMTTYSQLSHKLSHCFGTQKCPLCNLRSKSKKSDPATTFFVGAVVACFSTI